MKKSISVFLCLILILSSFSFAFASPTSWDTSDQSNLQSILRAVTSYGSSNLYYYVSQIYSLTNTISNNVNTITGYLVDSGHGVAYWVNAISTWMSPIYNAITSIPTDLFTITGALGYYDTNNTYHPYLIGIEDLSVALTNKYKGSGANTWSYDKRALNGHYQILDGDGKYWVYGINDNGQTRSNKYPWGDGSPIGNLALLLQNATFNQTYAYRYRWVADLTGYNSTQTGLSWTDINQSVSFTPQSATDGLYNWLENIQTPVARLSYVLASDERIDAQEKAADNEQAVVDNFIDSTGSGAASTSDIDSIADFSSGYKTTFTSDASPTGIFNLFTSDNMSWFSQETANQLDTTSNNRAKSDNTFNTPLLDQQINSIYEQLGVKQP